MRPLLSDVRDSLIEGIKITYTNISDIRLGLLIGYLLIITILILFIWQPFLNYMQKTDIQAKKMLLIPPLELITKIRHIYNYIEKNLIQNNKP